MLQNAKGGAAFVVKLYNNTFTTYCVYMLCFIINNYRANYALHCAHHIATLYAGLPLPG
jgi:hypothetical protein